LNSNPLEVSSRPWGRTTRHYNVHYPILLLLIAWALLSGGMGPPAYAQTDAAAVARKAVEFLRSKLPPPFPGVDSYTFSPQTFPDAGLGCPAPGQTFSPVQTPGYKFLFTVKGVIYEVHTNLDGSAAVLCDSAAVKVETGLVALRTAQFSLPYPEKWVVTQRDANEYYIGVAAQQVCTQPGQIVTLLGKLPQGKAADSLLDDYLAANRNQQQVGDRAAIGKGGRTMLTQGACTDGSPRSFRVSAYIAFGQGYRLVQFTPGPAFNQWADVFSQIAGSFSPSATGNPGQPIDQPKGTSPTLFVHVYRGNLYAAAIDDLPGEPITRDADLYMSSRFYTGAQLSPDGKRIIFTDPNRTGLYLGILGKPTTLSVLSTAMGDSGYGPAWAPDGQHVAFIGTDTPLTVRTVDLAGKPGPAWPVTGQVPCPSRAASSPSATALAADRGLDLLFSWVTAESLVLARACNGLGAVRLNMQTGSIAAITQPISWPQIAPDRATLAGLVLGKLALLSLGDNQLTTLDVNADRVYWGRDALTLYYTTRAQTAPLKLDTTVNGIAPFSSGTFELTLHKLDLPSRVDTLLFQGEGYAIGSVAADSSGAGIVFSVVPSEAALLEGIDGGASAIELLRLLPQPMLYWLRTGAEAPTLLAETTQPLFGPSGSSALIGVPVAPRPGA
jgi:hypothetical protein